MRFTFAAVASILVLAVSAIPLDTAVVDSSVGAVVHTGVDAASKVGLGALAGGKGVVDANVGLGLGLGVGVGLQVGAGAEDGTKCSCSCPCPCPSSSSTSTAHLATPTLSSPVGIVIDIHVWARDLIVKIDAIVKLIDGKSSPAAFILQIIAEVDAAVKVLLQANVKIAAGANLQALVSVIASCLVSIVVAISKCGATNLTSCAQVLIQLDACLRGLVTAIEAHLGGFLVACGKAVGHLDVFLGLGLKAVLHVLLLI